MQRITPLLSNVRFITSLGAGTLMLATACSPGPNNTDTRGVLDLFVSGPLDVRLEGLVYLISGADAGVRSGSLTPTHPVMKLMMPAGQNYSVAVTGLGITSDKGKDGSTQALRLACEANQDFDIRELRTTEIDLNMSCEAVGATAAPVVDESCSIASMLVAPRIQHVGATILASADPFPLDAPLRFTTPDNGIGRILSAGEDHATQYAFECLKAGFSEIVAEVSDGACTARASSAVVCMEED